METTTEVSLTDGATKCKIILQKGGNVIEFLLTKEEIDSVMKRLSYFKELMS